MLGGKKIEQIEFNEGLETLGSGSSGVGLMSEIDVKIPDSVTENWMGRLFPNQLVE